MGQKVHGCTLIPPDQLDEAEDLEFVLRARSKRIALRLAPQLVRSGPGNLVQNPTVRHANKTKTHGWAVA